MTQLHKITMALVMIFFCLENNSLFSQETRLTRYTQTQENNFWMDMIDRATVLTFKPGIIRDYDTRMDGEYWIDHNSYDYSMLDDSRYVESKNGFRGWSGSINSSRFFTEGSFKVYQQIEDHFYFKADFTREENYQSEHDALLVTLGRNGLGDQRINLYGTVSLETDKEDFDFMAGVNWEPIDLLKIDFQVVPLDFLNNLMSGGISRHQLAEKRVLDSQPFAFRLRASYEWHDYRFEIFGATNTPEKATITFENGEFADFTEEIKYTYGGAKAEKQWRDNLTTGFYCNTRSAEHNRVGRDENNYQIKEAHSQFGAYGMYRFNDRWRFETDASYSIIQLKSEGDQFPDSLDTDDWGVEAKVFAYMKVKSKWEAQAGLLLDRRVMTTLLELYPLEGTNIRLALGFRYQFKENFYVMLTSNIGLENFYNYDGSSIQLQYLW